MISKKYKCSECEYESEKKYNINRHMMAKHKKDKVNISMNNNNNINQNSNYLNIDTFYMSAKFFDANIGQFIRMMNTPQTMLANSSNPYTFNQEDYFYYQVKLNYPTQKYEVFSFPNNARVGIESQPIKWYEYVNP